MKMHETAFSLLELMVVVLIIGILTTLAVPAYKNYAIRARVTEGLMMAAAAKIAVSEVAIARNALPDNPEMISYQSPEPTDNVAAIQLGEKGLITISYTPLAGGGTLILRPKLQKNGDVLWDCKGGSLAQAYRPVLCR